MIFQILFKRTSVWIVMFASWLFASTYFPADAQDVVLDGINWSRGIITAEAYGSALKNVAQVSLRRMMACRSGQALVQRAMLERTQGVRIDSVTLVKDAMVVDDTVRSSVQGLIRGVHITNQTMMPDGSCKVEAEMPIAGKLFELLIPKTHFAGLVTANNQHQINFSTNSWRRILNGLSKLYVFRDLFISDVHAESVVTLHIDDQSQMELAKIFISIIQTEGLDAATAAMQRAMHEYHQSKEFSGVIIDARGVPDFHPAALPWIRNQEGVKLYPNSETNYEIIKRIMPVSYDFSIEDAMQSKRVASKPLVIKASEIYHSRKSDLVLNTVSAAHFLKVLQFGIDKKARILTVIAD